MFHVIMEAEENSAN